nr:hypothetical protein [Telmatocola sphagniphila]
MTAQGLVPFVDLAFPTGERMRGHRFGIVPPEFPRRRTEEMESFDQTMQDRLGPFAGQRQHEGAIGVSPGRHQNGNQLATTGKIDVNVAEIRFESLTRLRLKGNKRLALDSMLRLHVNSDAIVAPAIAMLIAQPTVNLGRGVTLLAGSFSIAPQDLLNNRCERVEQRWHGSSLVRLGFRLVENLTDLPPGMMKSPGQCTDAHLIYSMSLTYSRVFVHLDHPLPPAVWDPSRGNQFTGRR